MNVWNKLVALQVALNLLILVSCSKDGSSTEGMQCFKERYINYQVYTTNNADDKIEDASSVRTYNNMPFSAENINASIPYIADEWLIRKIEEGDNPFYTHCEYFNVYYNCISVDDTFYVEKCVDSL